jgi:hypothetical protein
MWSRRCNHPIQPEGKEVRAQGKVYLTQVLIPVQDFEVLLEQSEAQE